MEVVLLIIIVVLLVGAGVGFFFFRRHWQQQLKMAMRRAQKSEQLKAVFIDNACHTLRTPLNAISGYSTMILETPDTMMQPDHVRELAGKIEKNSKQLLGFVDQLVELSKFEGITPSFTFIEVNLTELMASYRREAMNYTKPDVAVQVRTDLSPHCKGTLDTNFMHQLMMHLLKNAAMHTTQGAQGYQGHHHLYGYRTGRTGRRRYLRLPAEGECPGGCQRVVSPRSGHL